MNQSILVPTGQRDNLVRRTIVSRPPFHNAAMRGNPWRLHPFAERFQPSRKATAQAGHVIDASDKLRSCSIQKVHVLAPSAMQFKVSTMFISFTLSID